MKKFKKLFTKRKTIIALIILLLIGVVMVRRNSQKNTSRPVTVTISQGSIASTVSASGQVVGSGRLEITTQASGVVKNVYVSNGDIVTTGQALAQMTLDGSAQAKSAQGLATYLSAKSTLEGARATAYSLQAEMFTKWRTFFDLAEGDSYDDPHERTVTEFYIPEKEWLAAESKYKNQENVVAAAQASFSSAWLSYQQVSPTILAPGFGTVSDITIVPGMVLSGSTSTTSTSNHIATIINSAHAIITVNLSEVDVSKVSPRAKATIRADAFPGKSFTGYVAGVNTSGVVENGVTNFPATVVLDENETDLLPNMAVTAVITLTEKQNVLLAPSAAVINRGNTSFVRVLKNGAIIEIPVETGISSDTEVEIISGLSEGDVIVVGNAPVGTGASQTQGAAPFGVFRMGGQGGAGRTGGGRQSR